jgi:hypothetical protein
VSSFRWGNIKEKECSACYIWGFTFIPKRNGTQKAQRFLCGRFLAKGNKNPTNLKEHLILSVGPENMSDCKSFLCRKQAWFQRLADITSVMQTVPNITSLSQGQGNYAI